MQSGNQNARESGWKDVHEPERQFFRCPVPTEHSAATLRVSGVKIPVELHESSIDGFAVLVQQKYTGRLRLGPRWVLQSASERSEVCPQWLYCAPDGRVQVGLRRLQDLTPAPKPRWLPRLGRSRPRDTDYTLVFAALVLIIGLAVSLPGLGDVLGTAPWIEQTVQDLLGGSLNRISRGA